MGRTRYSDSDSDSDPGDGGTVGDLAQQLSAFGREAVALRESMQGSVPLAERRRLLELQLGKDFVAQLRRADDWLYEGALRMGGEEVDGDGDHKRAVFCFHAAQMTHDCHGSLWPHLKYQNHRKEINPEDARVLRIGLAEQYDCMDQMDAANRALGIPGIDGPVDAVPPRRAGGMDLDSLEGVAARGRAPSSAPGIKGSILAAGELPSLVCVERRDEREAVALHARCLWRDAQGALLLEVLFMHNRRETFQAPGSLALPCLRALRDELGEVQKIVCSREELGSLLEELRANSAEVSVACHMRRREGFAGGERDEEAIKARVVREPLEVSFLRVSPGRSTALLGALDAKARANARFAEGLLAEALELYREALGGLQECGECGSEEVQDEVGKVHANMAECHLRRECWAEALASAGAALEADACNVKALFRRAKAHEAIGQTPAAIADLRAALRVDPGNQQVTAMLARLRPGSDLETPPPSARAAAAATPSPEARPGHQNARTAVGGSVAPAAWAVGLSPAMQREWLVDCYRMHVDDQYVYAGGNLRGLYAGAFGGGNVSAVPADFLLFCKLAARHGVVPDGWDWAAFLACAEGLLRYAFEKSDANEKYGQENVFAVAMGGRSLRYTAEVVYDKSVYDESSEVEEEVERSIRAGRFGDELYQDVGGAAVWRAAGMAPESRRGGKDCGGGKGRGVSGKSAGRSRACRNYQAGHCVYGERCHFSHEGPQGRDTRAPLCRFWQSGSCAYGDSCRYRHGSGS